MCVQEGWAVVVVVVVVVVGVGLRKMQLVSDEPKNDFGVGRCKIGDERDRPGQGQRRRLHHRPVSDPEGPKQERWSKSCPEPTPAVHVLTVGHVSSTCINLQRQEKRKKKKKKKKNKLTYSHPSYHPPSQHQHPPRPPPRLQPQSGKSQSPTTTKPPVS